MRKPRKHPDFIGVRWSYDYSRWEAFLNNKSIGFFDLAHEAALCYDQEARKHNQPCNFKYRAVPCIKPLFKRPVEVPRSSYRGVSWKGGSWQAQYTPPGSSKRLYLGLYAEEEHAAIAHDKAAIKHEGYHPRFLNFDYGTAVLTDIKPIKRKDASIYGKYISYIKRGFYQVKVGSVYIGIFKRLEDAQRARDTYCQQRYINTNY